MIELSALPPSLEKDDLKDNTFECFGWVVHVVPIRNKETNDVAYCKRLVLFNKTFQTIAFVSQGAFDSMRRIVAMNGEGPYKEGLKIRIRSVKTNSGFRTYNLSVPSDDKLMF